MDADDENKFAHSTGHLVEINKVMQAFLKLEEDFKTSRKFLSTHLDRRCRREFLRIHELMKLRIFDTETNQIQ